LKVAKVFAARDRVGLIGKKRMLADQWKHGF
jgi:hypothetical protein